MREAHDYYTAGIETGHPQVRRDELCRCCARALRDPRVGAVLQQEYLLADDFELYVEHPDGRKNFCEEDT
jgi:hypothetical protein